MIPKLSNRRMSALLWSCALLGVLALGMTVPPFQFPDEPHHFAAAMIHAWGEEERAAIESETIGLMDRFNWWTLTGMGRPARLPGRISDIRFLMADSASGDFRDRIQGFVLYHRIAGKLLAAIGARDPAVAFFFLRFLSLAFGLGGLVFLALALRTLGSAWDKELYGALALAVFLPQLAFIGIGVSPDMFVFLLGAAFFWAAVGILASKAGLGHAIVLLAAAGLGFLTDRSALVFSALLVLIPVLAFRKRNASKVISGSLLALVASIAFVYVLALLYPLQLENIAGALKTVASTARKSVSALGGFGPFEVRFWLQFVDSSFLRFGWMQFAPPRAWIWIWRLAWLAGAAGLGVGLADFVRGRIRGNETETDSVRRRLILFCLAAFMIQALGVWVFYGPAHILPQGRYLIPVLPAFLALLAAGLRRLGDAFRPGAGRRAVLAFAVFLIFAWIYALWAIAIPVFQLTIRSPYPGI